jgi:hypothetical protein
VLAAIGSGSHGGILHGRLHPAPSRRSHHILLFPLPHLGPPQQESLIRRPRQRHHHEGQDEHRPRRQGHLLPRRPARRLPPLRPLPPNP